MAACVLDTDVVIAALDRADAHHRAAADAFERFAEDKVELLLCTVNYAEALVRPAADERDLRAAVNAIALLGIRPLAPDAAVARNAARRRGLGISLADGFALATAERVKADVASFDKRVRRALDAAGLRLSPTLVSLSKSAITVDGWRPTGPVGSRGDDGLAHNLFVDPKI